MNVSVQTPPDEFRLGRLLRPIDADTYRRIGRAPWVLYLLAAASGLPFIVLSRAQIRHYSLAIGGGAAALLFGVLILLGVEVWPATALRRPGLFAAATMVVGAGLTTLALVSLGPKFGIVAVTYPEPVIFAFVLFRLEWAFGMALMVAAEAAAVMFTQRGWFAPGGQWAFVVTATIGTSMLAGVLAARFIASTAAEHRARAQLDEMNATLKRRVDEQVAELARVGQLRRFVAPQVAEAIVSGQRPEILRPHRQRIAVLFCDLRGFTRFAAQVEPEDVIEVLDAYYRVVGELLREHDATIGSFAGDGIMAYLNDPVPCADPAAGVVEVARAIRSALGSKVEHWRRLGFDLSFGIGVAVGHATLGVIGFEGRHDYTALGTVVNLAARLCAAAGPGEILLDPRTRAELGERVETQPVSSIALKGFPDEMQIFAVD